LGFKSQQSNNGIFYIQTGSGVYPASYPLGTRSFYPGVKPPGFEADQTPPSSTEVKNVWSYTSTAPVCLLGMVHN